MHVWIFSSWRESAQEKLPKSGFTRKQRFEEQTANYGMAGDWICARACFEGNIKCFRGKMWLWWSLLELRESARILFWGKSSGVSIEGICEDARLEFAGMAGVCLNLWERPLCRFSLNSVCGVAFSNVQLPVSRTVCPFGFPHPFTTHHHRKLNKSNFIGLETRYKWPSLGKFHIKPQNEILACGVE